MLERDMQEREEYDSRLAEDSPFARSAPRRDRPESEYQETQEAFETPFVSGAGGKRDCGCGCRPVSEALSSETGTLGKAEALEAMESDVASGGALGESETPGCASGCPEPSKAYADRIGRNGAPKGSVIERTEGDPRVNLALQLFDYDVNEYRVVKERHVAALARIREFIVDARRPVAVTITGLASRTGSASFNDVLSCQRAECVAENLRQSLSHFPGVSNRVQINSRGEGFTRATCKGSDCELGEFRSVLVQVHAPDSPPKPVPPVEPGWDKYSIRCCSFHSQPLGTALLGDILNKRLPNIPDNLRGPLIQAIKKGLGALKKLIIKSLPKLGRALQGLDELLLLFPAEFIRDDGVFEIRERDKASPRSMILCLKGLAGLRLAVPQGPLDGFLDGLIGKVALLKALPEAVKKQIREVLKKTLTSVIRPYDSDKSGPFKDFNLREKKAMGIFPGRVQIGKGFLDPGRVNIEFDSPVWHLPDPPKRPMIVPCPSAACSGVQTQVGDGSGREFFAISVCFFEGGKCTCEPAATSRELETEAWGGEIGAETEVLADEAEAETEALAGEAETELPAFGETLESPPAETESFEIDPYSSIRAAMSPEHANLSSEEITVVLGHRPAALALHQLLDSPATRQATLATLLGSAARRTVRINGRDISIPGYLRVVSRLCRDAAGDLEGPGEGKEASTDSKV